MTEILRKFRAVVFAAIALFLYLLGHRQASNSAENKQMKGNLDAVQKAKKSRDSLSNPAVVDRLHKKYRR